jgi:hypothetical protein
VGQSNPVTSDPVRDWVGVGAARPTGRADGRRYDPDRFPELDCLNGLLPPETLASAARRAEALGIGAERVLIAHGVISEDVYLQRLSLRSGIRMADFSRVSRGDIDLNDHQLRLAAKAGVLQMRIGGAQTMVASLRDDTARVLARAAAASPRALRHWRLTSEQALQDFLLYRTNALIGHAIDGLRDSYPALSAAPDVSPSWLARALRRACIGLLVATLLLGAIAFPGTAGHLLALLFLAGIGLRLVASFLPVRAAPIARIADKDLPIYSVVVALYREAPSVPQLLAALGTLDYPREKLDVILVVETDDLATRAAIARVGASAHVRVIVAPNEGPRTKPKALNVALPFARGEFLAVYDAEDRPDPDQLRAALAAFSAGDDNLACVQACLAIENSGDSLITRGIMAQTPQAKSGAGIMSLKDDALQIAYAELRRHVADPICPEWVKSSCLRLSEIQTKLFVTVPNCSAANDGTETVQNAGAPDGRIRLEPSDFLCELLAAMRALDWPRVHILIHGALPKVSLNEYGKKSQPHEAA